jgi:glycosyltransferase involved in cell wall biosynthesis
LKLIILHYHLRPGGIRRIIELATPHLLNANSGIEKVILATGEDAAANWKQPFAKNIAPAALETFVEPAFIYLSEQNLAAIDITRRIQAALKKLLASCDDKNTLVWAHNLGIARNLILTREIARACAAKNIPLISHHHDWWFDNRWLRWPEMRRFGFRTLATAAKAIFPAPPNVRHFTINQSDATQLKKHLGNEVGWLPNLSERAAKVSEEKLQEARSWLRHQLNDREAPVWILPCRLLRRKNVAEALLLTRWLRPEAWLVTTGGVSSADEQYYSAVLSAAAHQHHWRLRLGILAGNETRKPSVAELLATSEAVMLTSIQEGFGLPYLEAAASRRPLIARGIPNIMPDLNRFGFKFPQCYEEILVAPELFDWRKEFQRQAKLFNAWREQLPRASKHLVGEPALLASGNSPRVVPFSRLTLSAQIEVLSKPARESWEKCAALNPFLAVWKKRAAQHELKITPWPRSADEWLSGPAYAKRFYKLANRPNGEPPTIKTAVAAQNDFIRAKLDAEHLFPLLWSKQT